MTINLDKEIVEMYKDTKSISTSFKVFQKVSCYCEKNFKR